MKVMRGRAEKASSSPRSETFTGGVWGDPVMAKDQGVTINTVLFTPGARTYWHAHEHGQVLHVTAGKGWVCAAGEPPHEIRSGDIVWIPPNERHWHGATESSYMVHIAISLGTTNWQDEVADVDYPK